MKGANYMPNTSDNDKKKKDKNAARKENNALANKNAQSAKNSYSKSVDHL